MGSTTKELVADLLQKVHDDNKEKVMAIVTRAENGYYHDFLSPAATPKTDLYYELMALGFVDLGNKIKAGDYDDEAPDDIIST